MMPLQRIQTVLFDVGGTILRVEPSVGAVYAATAADHGFLVCPERIERRFRAAWARSLVRSHARGYRASDEILRSEWFDIVRETLGGSVPSSHLRALFDDLYNRFVSTDVWRLVPGIRETLTYLRSLGVRLGIVSNWDSRLRRMIADFELDRAFDFIVVSHEVGYEKPHAKIFQAALRSAFSEPERTLHVGDSYHADIAPARALLLRTLWVAPGEERELEPDGGPGIDKLPDRPVPFWPQLLGWEEANTPLNASPREDG